MARYLTRYIHGDGGFKAFIVDATGLGQDAFEDLTPSPIALQLITQAMSAALLLSANLKDEGVLNLKLAGDGPMDSLTAEANTSGEARAVTGVLDPRVQEEAEAPLLIRAIGEGKLTVRRKTYPVEKVFTSVVEMVRGELSLNIANYLLQSEQTPSAVLLGAQLDPDRGVAGAGGVLIQALPGANEHLLFILEDRLSRLPPLGSFFAEPKGEQRLIAQLFEDIEMKFLGSTQVRRTINDSPEAMRGLIASLPVSELQALAEANEPLTIRNAFGGKPFVCGLEELERIIRAKRG